MARNCIRLWSEYGAYTHAQQMTHCEKMMKNKRKNEQKHEIQSFPLEIEISSWKQIQTNERWIYENERHLIRTFHPMTSAQATQQFRMQSSEVNLPRLDAWKLSWAEMRSICADSLERGKIVLSKLIFSTAWRKASSWSMSPGWKSPPAHVRRDGKARERKKRHTT